MKDADQSAQPPAGRDPLRIYLALLDAALANADAAIRHDALIDAEFHLRDAVAGGMSIERAIAEYGAPEEVADAYLQPSGVSMQRSPGAAATAASSADAARIPAATETSGEARESTRRRLRDIPVVGIWFHPIAWRALAYFGIVSFPLATAYFVWAVAVGSIAIGTVPTLIGLPLLVFLLGSARALSLFEGKVIELFLGVRMPRRTQPVAGVVADGVVTVGFWRRIWCWLRDVRSWMSLGFLVGNFPVSLAAFVMTLALSLSSLVLVALPIIDLLGFPIGHADEWDGARIQILFYEVKPDADGNLWMPSGSAIPTLLSGLVLLTATLWLMRGMGWIYGHVVQAIQVARPRPTATPR